MLLLPVYELGTLARPWKTVDSDRRRVRSALERLIKHLAAVAVAVVLKEH
jgi:hypothetical protein